MEHRYLFPGDYMADPSAHVFNGKLYIYPSHDRESGIAENDNGDHFDMKDYHCLQVDDPRTTEARDCGMILSVEDIPWAGRQLWDNDVVEKDGRYYLIYSMKDQTDIFRLGVAVSDTPEGPFVPHADPIRGSYSIDPCAFRDDDGSVYVYFGGIWGGQLQRYRDNKQRLDKKHYRFSEFNKRRFVIGSYVLQKENQEKLFLNAGRVRRMIVDKMNELFKDYDGLIMPSTPDIAPKFGEVSDRLSDEYLILGNHLVIGNFGGFPSISIPSGFVSNMPVSVNITGRAKEDNLVLNIANKIEEVLGCKGMVAKDE